MTRAVATDVAIAGAGIIGLSLGLELRRRGISVTILERDRAMQSASWAAGGMLAVHDPQNPPQLLPLASLSWSLYPGYLDRVQALSECHVPLRTRNALQHLSAASDLPAVSAQELGRIAPGLRAGRLRFTCLDEASLDPRDLCRALPRAFSAAGGILLEFTKVLGVKSNGDGVQVSTSRQSLSAASFVNCCGAWSGLQNGLSSVATMPLTPVKGQMVNLRCPSERLSCVVRAPEVYLVPRGDGRIAVGATLERAGFDTTVQPESLQPLIDAALRLLPDATLSDPLDCWAGLRPGTPDNLPVLGSALSENCFYATGHYRDGILLAPATAHVMSQLILEETPSVSLEAFTAARFAPVQI